jgi:hypothetical protein
MTDIRHYINIVEQLETATEIEEDGFISPYKAKPFGKKKLREPNEPEGKEKAKKGIPDNLPSKWSHQFKDKSQD